MKAEQMSPHESKKLTRIARQLESALETIHEMLNESDSVDSRQAVSFFDAVAELERLRTTSRAEAEAGLSKLHQRDLGAVFMQAGGSGADKKKPKAWLIEQILWRVYDFERGHEAIRGHSET